MSNHRTARRALWTLALLALTLVSLQPAFAATPAETAPAIVEGELDLLELLAPETAPEATPMGDPCIDCLIQCYNNFGHDLPTLWRCESWCYQTVPQCNW